ncbi:hypothetical protein JCM9279_004560 [Rhodotorula babjevae]
MADELAPFPAALLADAPVSSAAAMDALANSLAGPLAAVHEPVAPLEDSPMVDGTSTADATLRVHAPASSAAHNGALQPASSAQEPMPPAAQPPRPATPPRTSSFIAVPSSTSSQQTITAAMATLSQARSTSQQLTQTEPAEDSPDPLRIVPSSSAARSSRTRSPSAGPSHDRLRSSPTHARSRHRSKTPSASFGGAAAENLGPPSSSSSTRRGSRAPSAPLSLAGARARGMSAVPEGGAPDSDDELALSGAPAHRRSSGVSTSGRRGQTLAYVEIPPAKGSAGMPRAGGTSARAAQGKGPASGEGKAKLSSEPEDGHRRTRTGQPFEFDFPAPRSRPSSGSPLASPNPPAAASTPSTTAPAPTLLKATPTLPFHPAEPQHPSAPHEPIPPSSPLTSLPPSQLDRTSPAPPAAARAKRPRRSAAAAVPAMKDDSSSADEGGGSEDEGSERGRGRGRGLGPGLGPDSGQGGSSSATELAASPKKKVRVAAKAAAGSAAAKPKRPLPTVKKSVAAAAKAPSSVGRVPKAATAAAGKGGGGARRVSAARSSALSSSSEEEDEVSGRRAKGKAPVPASAKGKGKEKEKKGAGLSTEWDEAQALKLAAAEANRSTRRRSSMRSTLKEASSSPSSSSLSEQDSSEEDSDADSDDTPRTKSQVSPKKRARPPTKAKPRPSTTGTPKRAKPSRSSEIKDKGKAKQAAPSSSSPTKGSWLPPPGSFGSQIGGTDRAAPPQTSEERARDWNLNALPRDRPVWAHVRKEDAKEGFWWPAQLDCPHWQTPLRVKLLLDGEASILEYSPETIEYASPDHDDLVTFRLQLKLRFDHNTFRDSPDIAAPSDAAFKSVLGAAVIKYAGPGESDDDDDEGLLPPSSIGTSGTKPGSQARARAAVERDESSESSEDKEVKAQVVEDDEDERWLDGGGEDAGVRFPFFCLAYQQRTWWAARAASYEQPSPSKNGKRSIPGKFVVEYTDGTTGKVSRKDLLTPTDSKFFTVEMGETELAVPKTYVADLRKYCLTSLPPMFDKIIKEQLPLAAPFNNAFHAGGSKREHLAKMSAFGELPSDALDTVQDAINQWVSGATSADGQRPTGSERYEALESSERNQYSVDVLLSIAVALNYADDEGLGERAEADLKSRGVAEPSEDQIEEEAFKLARGELDLRSATKTIEAIRQSRHIVSASREQKAKESRTRSR